MGSNERRGRAFVIDLTIKRIIKVKKRIKMPSTTTAEITENLVPNWNCN
jgi:hypothetical protein